jgi:hypothetical protein
VLEVPEATRYEEVAETSDEEGVEEADVLEVLEEALRE